MNRLCLFTIVLASAAAAFVSLAPAQVSPLGETTCDDAEAAEVHRILDEVESEIERRENLFQAGSEIHAKYLSDLIQQYRRVANEIELARQQALASKLNTLQRQQRRVALKLWHLDRLRPMLAEVDEEYRSLTRTLRDLRQQHRECLRDEAIADRVARVSAAVEANERERLKRRMMSDRGFYDVRSWPELQTEPTREAARRAENKTQGPLDQLRVPIQRLARLRWDEGRMVVERDHWEALFLPESLATIALEIAAELKSRGWRLSQNAHRSFLPEKIFFEREPSPFLLFQNLRHAASQLSDGPVTSNLLKNNYGGEFATDQVMGLVVSAQDRFVLTVGEREAPKRHFRLEDSSDGTKLALFLSEDVSLELNQIASGAVIRFQSDGKSIELSGTTMADVYAKSPQLIEESIFPLLETVGVILPETRFDSRLIGLVITKLRLSESAVSEELDRLLQQADSSRFENRTRAMKALESNLDLYAPLIAEVQRDEDLSLEVRMRLKRVVEIHQREFGAIEMLIAKMDLTHDADYLRAILDRVSAGHREILQVQLRRLSTSESP